MKPWKKVKPDQIVYNGRRKVVNKTFLLPNGSTEEFQTWGSNEKDYVGVIAIDENNKVLLARQFRFGPEIYMDELPGGGVEKHEDYEEAVLRELKEETGYEPKNISFLGTAAKDAYVGFMHHYYLATDCKKVSDQNLDRNELIETIKVTIDELVTNAQNGKMSDPVAVLMAYDELMKIKGE